MDNSTIGVSVAGFLGFGQAYLAYRLHQQDAARNEAREEAKEKAAKLAVELKTASKETSNQLGEIHVLVNNRLSEALERVATLEDKLGLFSGEALPNASIVTKTKAQTDEEGKG